MKKSWVVSVTLLLAVSGASSAQEGSSSSQENQLNPWTDCGLGAMIFSNTKWAAAISNVIWDLGTTAVTSAAASKNTCEGADAVAATFINETYVTIEEETVKGGGEHVHAMLSILGCQAGAHSQIISSVRNNFRGRLSDASYAQQTHRQRAEAYYNLVQATVSDSFAQQCQSI